MLSVSFKSLQSKLWATLIIEERQTIVMTVTLTALFFFLVLLSGEKLDLCCTLVDDRIQLHKSWLTVWACKHADISI